jgi:hypothetical protein
MGGGAAQIFLLHVLRNAHGNRGRGDGSVGEDRSGNLVAAATHASGTEFDGLANDKSNREGDVSDDKPGDDAKGGVEDQAENCTAKAKSDAANESGMAVLGRFALEFFCAAFSSQSAVDAVVADGDGAAAGFASVAATSVFGGGKLGHGAAWRGGHARGR